MIVPQGYVDLGPNLKCSGKTIKITKINKKIIKFKSIKYKFNVI